MSASLTDTSILAGASQPSGYNIDKSCRFNQGDTPYLAKTMTSAGDRKKWTASFWYKRSVSASTDNPLAAIDGTLAFSNIQFASDMVQMEHYPGTTSAKLRTTRLFRDPSSWYHIVMNSDTTLATADDRMKIYVNGVQETDFAIRTNPAQNMDWYFNDGSSDLEVSRLTTHGQYLDGYLTEFHYIDGQALTPSSFAETDEDTSQWKAIKYAGTYGTNGFFLEFENSSALGSDTSGNGNDFTVTNLVASDQMIDTPQNTVGGNFAILNPLAMGYETPTLSEGNLKMVGDNGSNDPYFQSATVAASSGKWYAEFLLGTSGENAIIGVMGTTMASYGGNYIGNTSNTGTGYYPTGGTIYNTDNSGSTDTTPTNAVETDIIGVLLDLDDSAGKIYFYKNNTILDTAIANDAANSYDLKAADPMWTFAMARESGVTTMYANFGADSSFAGLKTAQGNSDGNGCGDFYYTPPAGYLAMCSNNMSDPTISTPTEHFNVQTWAGSGADDRQITTNWSVGLSWIKKYSASQWHSLSDKVRAADPMPVLYSNDTSVQATDANALAFNSTGYTVDDNAYYNASGSDYVGWAWKGSTSANVTNTEGSMDSIVSANPTAGFSVVGMSTTGTGGTITLGHGLSQAPEVLIGKPYLGGADNWRVGSPWHNGGSNPWSYVLLLNSTVAQYSHANCFNSTAPTSSVFTAGSDGLNNGSYQSVIYCFHSVEGYSKMGTYRGNGSGDGSFIYTGFRPAYFFIKNMSNIEGWLVWDNAREPYNKMTKKLSPNTEDAQYIANATTYAIDLLSNGIKLRTNYSAVNQVSTDFLFMAFAEYPFKYSRAR